MSISQAQDPKKGVFIKNKVCRPGPRAPRLGIPALANCAPEKMRSGIKRKIKCKGKVKKTEEKEKKRKKNSIKMKEN